MSIAIEQKNTGFLSGTTLKLIACIAMFVDHFGLVVFPQKMIFRIIGRIAFPIFAYFIAEGCKYTRNKLKHFLLIFSVGVIYFFFYLFAFKQVYPSIFLTFSVSILNVYLIDALKQYALLPKQRTKNTAEGTVSNDAQSTEEKTQKYIEEPYRVNICRVLLSVFVAVLGLAVSYIPFHFVLFDYGYVGMLAPVVMSLFDFSKIKAPKKIEFLDSKLTRIVLLACICVALAIRNPELKTEIFGFRFTIQVFNVIALPILALYNGKVGTKKLKYFFYAFYPAHLGVIMLIKMIIDALAN